MYVNPYPNFPLNQYRREINLPYQRFGQTSGLKRPDVSSSLSSGCKKKTALSSDNKDDEHLQKVISFHGYPFNIGLW